jgi:hypothetical protein
MTTRSHLLKSTSRYLDNAAMPQRTEEHEIAEVALTAIQAVIATAGFAVERVTNDYGEDLLVQTSYEGQMDASRLWVQAKGTRSIGSYARSDGRYALSMDRSHLTRWARSADPVVIVLWDCLQGAGCFTRVDDRPRAGDETDTAMVYFDSGQPFDTAHVIELAWMSRIDHYKRLILAAHEEIEEEEFFGVEPEEELGKGRKLLVNYALDLLRMFGVMECEPPDRWSLSDSGKLMFARELIAAEAESDPDPFLAASAATSLRHASEQGVGLPTAVISEMARVIYMITVEAFKRDS